MALNSLLPSMTIILGQEEALKLNFWKLSAVLSYLDLLFKRKYTVYVLHHFDYPVSLEFKNLTLIYHYLKN